MSQPHLTLRAVTHLGDGPPIAPSDPVVYEVDGLPPGQQLIILKVNHSWRIRGTLGYVQYLPDAQFETADAALRALQVTLA